MLALGHCFWALGGLALVGCEASLGLWRAWPSLNPGTKPYPCATGSVSAAHLPTVLESPQPQRQLRKKRAFPAQLMVWPLNVSIRLSLAAKLSVECQMLPVWSGFASNRLEFRLPAGEFDSGTSSCQLSRMLHLELQVSGQVNAAFLCLTLALLPKSS